MRIAIATGLGMYLPAQKSQSIARIVETLIEGFQSQGHKVLVFAPADCVTSGQLIPICERHVPLTADLDLTQNRQAFRTMIAKLSEMRDEIDIVHAQTIDIPGVFHSSDLLSTLSIPNVTTFQSAIHISNLDFFRSLNNRMVSVSYNQRKACPELNYVSNIYNALYPAPFPMVRKPDNYLCFLGRMNQVKQPHQAIQLAIQLGIPLRLAGPVDPYFDQSYFEHYCRPYFSHPLIEYLGELDFDEKIKLIAHARCNLHPTGFRDPCPLSPIESAYCGTPTLAIRRGALSEIVQEGKTGALVEDFAEGYYEMERCLTLDREYIAQWSRKKFNYKAMINKYLDVFATTIEQDRFYD